jgi:hypothetical protein
MTLITHPSRHPATVIAALLGAAAALGPFSAHAADTSAAAQLERWQVQAAAPGSVERGKAFFTSKHGGDLSCASCHGTPPTSQGRHASTGKVIEALAPAFNPLRFTDTAKVDKWFARNCKDVLARECTALEKADVLAYFANLKP